MSFVRRIWCWSGAEACCIDTIYDTWQELLDDERIEILGIAFPPDLQPGIIAEAEFGISFVLMFGGTSRVGALPP